MENSQVKVNDFSDNTELERFTDGQLTAELKRRGFEVLKWKETYWDFD